MQISELTENLLICHKDDVHLLPAKLREVKLRVTGQLRVFRVDSSDPSNEIPKHYGVTLRRYLDKFYLWAPEDNLERRQQVLNAFFDLVAAEYENLIDVDRNLHNNLLLLQGLQRHSNWSKGARVIDFGCGTGLSLKLQREFNVNLIGVDPCPSMRRVAELRGMLVWSPGQLARQPRNSLDGAFASYVFHLLPHTHGLRLLWARLRMGASLIANFHKDQGLELVSKCLLELGAKAESLTPPDSDRHGKYVLYSKVQQ